MSSGGALADLARQLREERTVISPHVVEPRGEPVLGPLAAAGPRAASAPVDYALVVESIREGYELHYGSPRILGGHDQDLALLAGDYLYALGLERLASLADGAAVAELSDLISLCAAAHAEASPGVVPALWLAGAVAVGCGGGDSHAAGKAAARESNPEAAEMLFESARVRAAAEGLEGDLARAAKSIDFGVPRPADSG